MVLQWDVCDAICKAVRGFLKFLVDAFDFVDGSLSLIVGQAKQTGLKKPSLFNCMLRIMGDVRMMLAIVYVLCSDG